MSDPLDTAIRQLLDERADQAPVASDWSEVKRRASRPGPIESPRRPRAVLWLAVAAASVLVVAGGIVLSVDDDPPRLDTVDSAPTNTTVQEPERTSDTSIGTTPSTPTTTPEPAPSTDSLRPLVELRPDDVIIPTFVPDGWTLAGSASESEFEFVDPTGERSISVLRAGGLPEFSTPPEQHFEVDGVRWDADLSAGGGLSYWVEVHADFGDNYVLVSGYDAGSHLYAFIAGLRAGPKALFPSTVGARAPDTATATTLPVPTTTPEPAPSTELLRPLVELGPDDVIIPTFVPDGWTLKGPPLESGFEFVDPTGERSISVLRTGRLTELSTAPEQDFEVEGVRWDADLSADGTLSYRVEVLAHFGDNYVLVSGYDAGSHHYAFIAGLRAGSKASLPGVIV